LNGGDAHRVPAVRTVAHNKFCNASVIASVTAPRGIIATYLVASSRHTSWHHRDISLYLSKKNLN